MPELAESFIIASQLAQVFSVPFSSDSGLQLPSAHALPWLLDPQRVTFLPLDKVYSHLNLAVGVVSVHHRGKSISIEIKRKTGKLSYLFVSLGMTGRFSIHPTPHDRVRINAKTGGRIFYTDIRKFGRLDADESHVPVKPSITSMANPSLVLELLTQRTTTLPIKPAITDQRLAFSGLGNYLANELMFQCGLHPFDPVSVLDEHDANAMLKAARDLASRSVLAGGCTLRDFRDMAGRAGNFQAQLRVHGQTTCPTCQREILRRGNPTTYFCQRCQPTRQGASTMA